MFTGTNAEADGPGRTGRAPSGGSAPGGSIPSLGTQYERGTSMSNLIQNAKWFFQDAWGRFIYCPLKGHSTKLDSYGMCVQCNRHVPKHR